MKRAVVLVVLACAPLPFVVADDLPPPPPLPPPSLPAVERTPTMRAPAGALESGGTDRARSGPLIRLGEKEEIDHSDGRGAGFVDEGVFAVKAEGGEMAAVLNASAYSHSFYGLRSWSVASIRLVQEFEVVSSDPAQSMVAVSLSAHLLGTIRTERNAKAGGALRVAQAVIAVPGGSPYLSLAFAPYERSGMVSERYDQQAEGGSALLPPGRYVLVADLVLETAVDECLRGHAEVLFAPPAEEGTWKSPVNPPPKPKKGQEHRFGFVVVVTATPSGG